MKATSATETATAAGGRGRTTKDLPACRKDNGAGGKYRAGGRGTEDSTDESAEWSGEEMEKEEETAGSLGETRRPLTKNDRRIGGKRRGRRTRGRSV